MSDLESFFGNGGNELLTLEEARVLVKRSRTEFWRIRERKGLRVHRIGRKGFVFRSELIKCFDDLGEADLGTDRKNKDTKNNDRKPKSPKGKDAKGNASKGDDTKGDDTKGDDTKRDGREGDAGNGGKGKKQN